MKYGTDPIALQAAQDALLRQIGQQQNTHWYMWIDTAFDVADERHDRPVPDGLHVYQVDNMLDLQHMGPHLLSAYHPGDSAASVSQRLRPWLEHASGRPMFSLWASDWHAQDLAQHVRHWSWAQTPEQKTVLLRLADTRSVCSLHRHLRPVQWQALTRPLRSWLYIDRQGTVQTLPTGQPSAASAHLPGAQDTPVLPPSIVLDEEQIQAMVNTAEPDAMLHHVATQMPDLLPAPVQPSKMHAYATWVIATAQDKGIGPWADKLSLLLAACNSQGAVMKDPRLEKIFDYKAYVPGQLHQILEEKGLLS